MSRKGKKSTSDLMPDSEPSNALCSRTARPTFASHREPPSTLLFVDVTAPKNKVERRKIRAHIMMATHESRRRRAMEDDKKRQAHNEIFRVGSPVQVTSSGNEDPFDSLPVKSFPGMNDLVLLYLENYPGAPPLTDDRLLRSKDESERVLANRSNTQWNLMITDESSFLIFLAGVARLRNTMSPCKKNLTDYLHLQQALIRSIRERMPSGRTAAAKIPEGYVFAVAAMGAAGAVFSDRSAALSHLAGARELIRLRGGIATFEALARRGITWCEWLVCAAFDEYPAIMPPAPPPPTWIRDDSDASSSTRPTTTRSPFPPVFAAAVCARHARTTAHLPAATGNSGDDVVVVDRIFEALTLVSAATTDEWRRAFRTDGVAKEAVMAVLDHVAHVLLVEVVRLVRGEERRDVVDGGEIGGRVTGNGEDDGECGGGAGEERLDGFQGGRCWVHAVLLHAANAYHCATLSEIPAISAMNLLFLKRLRNALNDGARGSNTWMQQCIASSSGAEVLTAQVLMWVLVVGWFLAEKTQAPGKAEMSVWFEAKIFELFSVMRIDEDQATEMVENFPATDSFRTKWHWLFLQDKFRGLH